MNIYYYTENKAKIQKIEKKFSFKITMNPENIEDFSIVFVDFQYSLRDAVLNALSKQPVFIILAAEETEDAASLRKFLATNQVDDVILTPFREIEFEAKVSHYHSLAKMKDVHKANEGIKSLIGKLEDDLLLARSIQRRFLPEKFTVPGLKIYHRHLSGLKCGGDYFDVFEFSDRTHVGILMSDCTGYGLSTGLLALMLRMSTRFGRDEPEAPSRTLGRIIEELKGMMKANEDLSLFFGVLNKNTLDLKYSSIGLMHAYRNSESLTASGPAIKRLDRFQLKDQTLQLNRGERLILCSDGFIESFGSDKKFEKFVSQKHGSDPVEFLNECVFQTRKDRQEDGIPPQDCSAILIDVERPVMRLAKA